MQMNNEMVESAVERLKALADATRIRIMMRLREGESNVTALSDELGIAQPTVSKHLATLRQAGIIKVRHEGAQSVYSIRDETVFGICDIVCSALRRQHTEDGRVLGIENENAGNRRNR